MKKNTRNWAGNRRKVSCKGINFHDLRHEAISRLYEGGKLNDLEIMQIVGHRSLAMTKRYTHLKAKALARKLA